MNIAINARDAIVGNGSILFENTLLDLRENTPDPLFNLNPGKYICTRIVDDGCGMTEEVKQHLFEPFYTTKALGKGTGMGLSAAYGTIKDHNGGIFVESLPDKGTTFRIFLPFQNPI